MEFLHDISAYLEAILVSISANFWLAMLFIFLVCIGEAVFILGLLVPSLPILLLTGGIIAQGGLPFWPIFFAATLGAIIGDAISYFVGWWLKDRIRTAWPFKNHLGLIAQGELFFQRHGGKAIFIGRFITGVKATVPGVAGMMGMSYRYFTFINVISAFVWAAAHIVPGMVLTAWLDSIGLSLELVIVVGAIVLTAAFLLVHYWKRIMLLFVPLMGEGGQRLKAKWEAEAAAAKAANDAAVAAMLARSDAFAAAKASHETPLELGPWRVKYPAIMPAVRHQLRSPAQALLALLISFFLVLPAAAEDTAADQQAALNRLFAQLHSATDAATANAISNQIWAIWTTPADPTLAGRMRDVMEARALLDVQTGIDLLDALVADYPDYAEGWNQRATLYYMLGDYEASIADCAKVLELEPRHYGALSGRALMYLQMGQRSLALRDMKAALELHPFLAEKQLFPELAQEITRT